MEELVRVERRVYPVRANWKLIVQNYSECLHCPVAHPLLHEQSHYMSGENDAPRATWLGGRMDLRDGVETLSMDGKSGRACLPGLRAPHTREVHYYALLPNLLLNLHPDYMLTLTLWPRAVDRTDVVAEWSFHPDAMRGAGLRSVELDRVLGPHEPPGLGALGARPGGHLLARLPSGPVLEPRGAAARVRRAGRRAHPGIAAGLDPRSVVRAHCQRSGARVAARGAQGSSAAFVGATGPAPSFKKDMRAPGARPRPAER